MGNKMKYLKVITAFYLCFSAPAFAADLSGKYVGKGDGSKNELQVKDLGNGKIKFSISTVATWTDNIGGRCTGGIDDKTASLHGNTATFTDEDGCKLLIEFKSKKAIVQEESCSNYHGAQCNFDATYSKKK